MPLPYPAASSASRLIGSITWFECTGFSNPSSQGDEPLMRRPNQWTDPDSPPSPELICDGGNAALPDLLTTEVDDATAVFLWALQPAFDLFRPAGGQFAGLLVLYVAGGSNHR